MIKEYIKIAFNNFRRRKKRTLLTLIGIFIGITAVVSLISIGQGLNDAISDQFEKMGTDKVMIYPKGGFFGVGGGSELTSDDMDFVKKISDVEIATGFLFKMARLEYKDEMAYKWAMGMPQDESKKDITDMLQLKIKEGRDLEKGDRKKAVITKYLREAKVFDYEIKVGDTLEIQHEEFNVVGVLEEFGNPEDDSQVLITLDDAREIFGEPKEIAYIFVKVQKGADVAEVAERIKKELAKEREVEEGEEDFIVQTMNDLMESFSNIFNMVVAVLIGIAAISLVVGGIGIMNTMYTSVLERTREIGILKAIGARNSQIMWLFLIESGILGMVGGIIGVVIGISVAKLVEFAAAQLGYGILKVSFSPLLIIGSLFFSFAVGALSGTMPARQASKLKPVEALRYE